MQLIAEQKGFNIVPLRGVPVCVNPVRVHLPRRNCSGVCVCILVLLHQILKAVNK